jgi:hypothetical protein
MMRRTFVWTLIAILVFMLVATLVLDPAAAAAVLRRG